MLEFQGVVKKKNLKNSPTYLTPWCPRYSEALIAAVEAEQELAWGKTDIVIESRAVRAKEEGDKC